MFVEATAVDALAVAAESTHAMRHHNAMLDLELIARPRASVPVPLVLHGSSGVEVVHNGVQIRVIGKENLGPRLGFSPLSVGSLTRAIAAWRAGRWLPARSGVMCCRAVVAGGGRRPRACCRGGAGGGGRGCAR
jgi:Fructose-bisphosphate aldolase class-II